MNYLKGGPVDMDLQIVFEDEDILIVNKTAGMTVNASETTKGDTLQDFVSDYLKLPKVELKAKAATDGEYDYEQLFLERGGIVHRIDKETSGILIVAKNAKAFERLQQQFKNRTVTKQYLALVHGEVKPPVGEVNVPVGRLPWNRMRFGVVAGGREAVTNYKLKQSYKNKKEKFSLLEVFPKTGRTHQIRVHMKHLGYPIFADFLYAGRKTARDDRKLLARVFLHAYEISFIHPRSEKTLTFTASLPKELAYVLESLATQESKSL